jgi:hypothetical protein
MPQAQQPAEVEVRRADLAVVLSTEPDMYAAHRLYQRRGYVRQPDRDWQAGRFRLMVFRLQL